MNLFHKKTLKFIIFRSVYNPTIHQKSEKILLPLCANVFDMQRNKIGHLPCVWFPKYRFFSFFLKENKNFPDTGLPKGSFKNLKTSKWK
jgi:hypothetical protein